MTRFETRLQEIFEEVNAVPEPLLDATLLANWLIDLGSLNGDPEETAILREIWRERMYEMVDTQPVLNALNLMMEHHGLLAPAS